MSWNDLGIPSRVWNEIKGSQPVNWSTSHIRWGRYRVRLMHRYTVQVCAPKTINSCLKLYKRLTRKIWNMADLFLDGIEVEILLAAHGFITVGIHDDRQVLVDQSDREHVSIATLAPVQEINSVFREIHGTAPDETPRDDWGLPFASIQSTWNV